VKVRLSRRKGVATHFVRGRERRTLCGRRLNNPRQEWRQVGYPLTCETCLRLRKREKELTAYSTLRIIKETGMVWLAEDQNFPRILVEPEWTAPEAVRQYRELLKKANFKRVKEETK